MNVVDKLVNSTHYMRILEHMRSQLDLKALSTFDVVELDIDEVQITAFSTKFMFELVYRRNVEVTASSMLILPGASTARTTSERKFYKIRGIMSEVLEPGQERPTFEFHTEPPVETAPVK